MLLPALCLFCLALAVVLAVLAILHHRLTLRVVLCERARVHDRAHGVETRWTVEHEQKQLRRAEAEIRALTERLVRLERVAPTTEDDVVKVLSQPPEL